MLKLVYWPVFYTEGYFSSSGHELNNFVRISGSGFTGDNAVLNGELN